MCGIAGYCLDPKHYSRIATHDIAGQMLYDIEHRGGDATGAAWINPRNGKRVISKAPVGAGKFVPSAGDKLCAGATSAILHTRFATQGSKDIAGNNHPIPRGRIVLPHNGHINHDKELFKQLGVPRVAQVDSEAVAALVAFSKVKPWEFLTEIYGTAALAWLSANDSRTLHLARVNSSPLWLGQAHTGSLFYGSTQETVENAAIMSDTELDWIYERTSRNGRTNWITSAHTTNTAPASTPITTPTTKATSTSKSQTYERDPLRRVFSFATNFDQSGQLGTYV